jgi:hypothetical protein
MSSSDFSSPLAVAVHQVFELLANPAAGRRELAADFLDFDVAA